MLKTLDEIDISEILENTDLLSTDTRFLEKKKYFICFKGEKYDAHDFLEELVANESLKYIFIETTTEIESNKLVKVDSSLGFYHNLANEYRKKVNPKVIAITGSSGKTTTKNLLKTVFERDYKIHATEANYNNEYGVPKTILSMPKDTQVLICEMGMRGLGQIDLLTRTAEPNLATITNIGTAHIEILGSREKIRQAKLEILNGFNSENSANKVFVLNDLADFIESEKQYSQILRDGNIELVRVTDSFTYKASPKFLVSEGILADMALVRDIALACGINKDKIQEALESFSPDQGRGNFISYNELLGKKNITFIDETYNANLEAIQSSVTALKKIFPERKKIVVLGNVKESDNKQVEALFETLKQDKDITLIDTRVLDYKEAKVIIDRELVDNAVVFFKASRSEKLEDLIALYTTSLRGA